MFGRSGIRTHASEETGALNQRLRPLGHPTATGLLTTSFCRQLNQLINLSINNRCSSIFPDNLFKGANC